MILFVNERFESIVRESDFEFAQLGTVEQYDRFLEDPDLWSATKGLRRLLRISGEHLPEAYGAILPHIQPGNTAVITKIG